MTDELERFYDSVWGDMSETAFEHKQLFDNNNPNKINPGKTRITSQNNPNAEKDPSIENIDRQCYSFAPPPNMVASYMANPNPAINPLTGMPYYLPPPGWCIMPSVGGYPYGYNPHYQPMPNYPANYPHLQVQPPAHQIQYPPGQTTAPPPLHLSQQYPQHSQQFQQQQQHTPVPHSIGPITIHRPTSQSANNGWINNAANGAYSHFLPLQQKQNVVTSEKTNEFWKDTAVCLSVGVLTLIALDVFTLSKAH